MEVNNNIDWKLLGIMFKGCLQEIEKHIDGIYHQCAFLHRDYSLGSFNKLSFGVSFASERTYFSPFILVAGTNLG